MHPRIYILLTCFTLLMNPLWAQRKLSFSNVGSGSSLRTGGTIMHNNQIKGHFLFSQDDRISEEKNAYTIHVMDENLNKVRAIKFEGSASLSISEAASNDSTLAFLFSDYKLKKQELRIYDNDGKLLNTYARSYTSKRRPVFVSGFKSHKNIDENGGLYNIGERGYLVIYTVRTARRTETYELNYYDHKDKKKNWKYLAPGELRYRTRAEFMAKTDSLFFLETTKMKGYRKFSAKITAFNIYNKKKAFEIDGTKDNYQFAPLSVIPQEGKDTILVVGSYYANGAKMKKSSSKGVAIYRINSRGAVLNKTYNTWGKEMARYLDVNSKGRLNSDNSYLYLHDAIKGPDGRLFIVGEGYKKTVFPAGVVFSTILLPWTRTLMFTRMKATDIVLMEFNGKDQLSRSSVYDKKDKVLGVGTDYVNKHKAAFAFKTYGSFDYKFTTVAGDNRFAICYYDKRKSSKKEFGYFNILRFNGQKFRQQEILMNSAEGNISVYPSKPGFLMVIENIRKEKKTEVRLEKVI